MASGDLGFGTTMKFRFLTFLFISWLLSISLQAEKGDVPITATDTSSDAGTRESTKKLKMVYKGEERTAKLKIPSGNYQQNEPKWSGNGVNGSPGSLTATFEGSSSTMAMIHSDDPPRDGEVNIELVPEAKKSIAWNPDKVDWVETQINSWLTSYSVNNKFQWGGSIDCEYKKVDFYNDGSKVGSYFKVVGGEIYATWGYFEIPFAPIPVITGVTLKPFGKFEALQAKFSAAIEFDESKPNPWINSTATLTASTQVEAGLELALGPEVVAAIIVSVTGSAYISAEGSISHSYKDVFIQGSVDGGEMKGTFEIKAQVLDDYELKLYTKEKVFGSLISFDSGLKNIYTIP